MKTVILFLSVCGVFTLSAAVDIYQAKCTITEGAGYKVDSCDARQFLSCQAGRCMCNDIGNQLYDYHLVSEKSNSRNKRGLKKKIAAGVAGGAVGYVVAKGVSNSASGSSSRQSSKFTKVYSCYGRVGSMCQLDYNNVNIVTLSSTSTTSSTTTTEVPNTTIASEQSNTTSNSSTTSTTTTQAPVVVVDVTKLPKCIRHATCTPQNKVATGSHIVKTNDDPRIGICACEPGYKVTTTDRCEKSGAMQIISSLPASIAIFYALVITKLF